MKIRIALVGYGNIGRRLGDMCQLLGMNVLSVVTGEPFSFLVSWFCICMCPPKPYSFSRTCCLKPTMMHIDAIIITAPMATPHCAMATAGREMRRAPLRG